MLDPYLILIIVVAALTAYAAVGFWRDPEPFASKRWCQAAVLDFVICVTTLVVA